MPATVENARHRVEAQSGGSSTRADPPAEPHVRGRSISGLLILGGAVLIAFLLVAWASGPGDGTPSGGGEAGGEVRTVVLDVRFSRFSESSITVRPGETVRFVVRNHDPIPHELIVGGMDVQHRHEVGTEAHHGDLPGEVTVPQNGTAETTYTFPPRQPGPILFGCHLPGHWEYGMQGVFRMA